MSSVASEAPGTEPGQGSGVRRRAADAKRSILFVDDEPAVLQSLRAVLWAQRHEWDMTFAVGGPAALEAIAGRAFDVVITDMRMPIVGGAEVLQQTKQLQPQAVRIVLSGQTDAETAMRSVFTAHQFLAKPCDIEKLRSVVKRACELHTLITADELRALAGDVSMLPAAPATFLAISRALASPACRIADVAALVEREPALCAKLLKVVNSAFFGLPRAVSSISQATSYLGTLALRNLALAMETVAAAGRQKASLSDADLRDFRANSLLVGMLARRFFEGDRRKADEAFVAGMLRDMGHLVLAARGSAEARDSECHAALSAYLLGLWGIPHNVIEPVAFHEQPERIEHESLETVDVVHLADRVAAELLPSPFQAPGALDLERLGRLGAEPAAIERLRAEAPQLLRQARELIGS